MSRKKASTKQRLILAKKKRGFERRQYLLDLAGNCCCLCGFAEKYALEFHHVGKKRFTLSSNVLGMIADEKLNLSEFARCVLLCSNCHKGIHAKVIKLEVVKDETGVLFSSR